MKNDKISLRRLSFAAIITIVNIVFAIATCYINSVLADKTICILVITFIFSILYFMYQIRARIDGSLPEKVYSSNSKLLVGVLASWMILIAFLFVPGQLVSFLVCAVILSAVCDSTGALILSIFYICIFSLSTNNSVYFVIGYVLEAIAGIMLAPYLKKKSGLEKLFSLLISFAVLILIPVICIYLDRLEISIETIRTLLYCSMASVFILSFIPLLFDIVIKKNDDGIYEEFMVDNFPLVEDIRHYSFVEFSHAKRVSRLCYVCASEIEADEKLCSCGGLYYRLGKTLGEPEIDNAMRLAEDYCFPQPLKDIIYEFGGILRKPTTPESAIVHMVDAVVTKIELLDRDSMSSSWNQNMVIYQTINELSEKGMYDDCGISMNKFLKVREKLVSEDILA